MEGITFTNIDIRFAIGSRGAISSFDVRIKYNGEFFAEAFNPEVHTTETKISDEGKNGKKILEMLGEDKLRKFVDEEIKKITKQKRDEMSWMWYL